MLRMIKIDKGMTGEFVVIITDATSSAIESQLRIRMEREVKGEIVDDEWSYLSACGYFVGFCCSDNGNMDDFDFSKIDAGYNLDDYCPEDISQLNNQGKIVGIVSDFGDGNFSYWKNISLSEEDEAAVRKILSKYETDGDSVYGTRDEILEEL